MAFQFLHTSFGLLLGYIDRFTSRPFWQAKYTLALIVYMMLTSFPNYELLVKPDTGGQRLAARLELIDWIAQHPFQSIPPALFEGKVLSEGDISHFEKRVVRVMIPLALQTTGISAKQYIAFQFLWGVIFVLLLIRFFTQHTSSRVAVLAGFMFANLFVTKWMFYDFFYHDPLAYLSLLVAMSFRNPFVVFTSIVVGCFTDERTAVAALGVGLWWMWQESDQIASRLKSLYNPFHYRASWATGLGLVVFVGLRAWMLHYHQMRADTSMMGMDAHKYNAFALGLTVSFEGAWLLIIGATVALIAKRDWFYLFVFGASWLAVAITGSIVLDLSRSFSYGFVLLLFALGYLYRSERTGGAEKWVGLAAACCFLFPTYYQIGSYVFWMPHIFPKIKVLLAFYGLI
ncbi:MAG: hypothetical protein MUE30_02565 [Spirosomaceae bacterium]|nr:hypothetical protein [Spirosomataceae bacterium]